MITNNTIIFRIPTAKNVFGGYYKAYRGAFADACSYIRTIGYHMDYCNVRYDNDGNPTAGRGVNDNGRVCDVYLYPDGYHVHWIG